MLKETDLSITMPDFLLKLEFSSSCNSTTSNSVAVLWHPKYVIITRRFTKYYDVSVQYYYQSHYWYYWCSDNYVKLYCYRSFIYIIWVACYITIHLLSWDCPAYCKDITCFFNRQIFIWVSCVFYFYRSGSLTKAKLHTIFCVPCSRTKILIVFCRHTCSLDQRRTSYSTKRI